MNNEGKLLTTGEFAKLCKVNKQTLFYYDQIGLLCPILKNEKGYRFYSIHQIELFFVIDLLKDLGMSLHDIAQYMKNKSPENFLEIMYEKKEEISKLRQEIETKEKIIETRISFMEEAKKLDFHEMKLVELPEATLYRSRNIEDIPADGFLGVISDFINELDELHLDTGYPIGVMTKREHIVKKKYHHYSYLYIEQPSPKEGYPYFHAIKGNFLVGYHIGDEKTIHLTYERLFAELNRLQLQVGDYVFEEYVYDTVVMNKKEQFVTKIMIHAEL
ncbi:MerR family transcriptional regulator [Bacillus sp. BGMRC 2118]|nr:MerR family transcriptional regulator [Bacillus sp. BGMRC 2118]